MALGRGLLNRLRKKSIKRRFWVVLRFQRCVYEATKSAGFRGCFKTLRRGGFWVAQRFTAAITGPFSSRL